MSSSRKRPRAIAPPDPPVLPTPASILAAWPENEAVLRSLLALGADGLGAFLPRPYALCGRASAGRTEAVEAVLACTGCLFSLARVAALETAPGLFGALARGVARGIAARVLGARGGGGAAAARAAAAAFMARVCHPSRGRAGWTAGAALVAWGDTSAGTLRRAYERALLGLYRGDGGEGAWGDAPGGATQLELLAIVQSTIPPARADSVAELAAALRALGALTLGDVCLGDACAVLRAAGLGSTAECAGAAAEAAAAAAEWPVAPWLVVDGADALGAEAPALLAAVLALRAEGGGGARVSVLLLAESGAAVCDTLRPFAGRNRSAAPTWLQWAGPSRERVLGALRAGAPPGAPPALYAEFVKRLAYALGGVLEWDVAEWRHAAEALWPPFFAPTRSGRVSEADAQGLYVAAAPAFAAFRARLPAHEALQPAAGDGFGGGGAATPPAPPPPPLSAALPRMPRLLLVAGFAASHTPPGQDVRYFSRASSGKRRAAAVARARAAGGGGVGAAGVLPMADGPHPFSLERLLSVAHALLAALDGVRASYALAHNELYLGGVAALLRARLLLLVEGEERGGGALGAARRPQRQLVANIGAEEAHALAATLAPPGAPPFSLLPYLHDPTVA